MDQIRYAFEHTTANPLAGDLSKPPLNEIHPRGGGRGEVAVKARMFLQPCPDFGVIVRTVVILNHVDVQAFGSFLIDLPQKLPEFDIPMPRVARTDDLALQHVQRRKQAGGPIAFVIMRHCPTPSFLHRQPRLSSIQGLDLPFLIHAKNNSPLRWVKVYSHHIGQLFDQPFVFRKLKDLDAVRLQPVRIPDPRDGGIGDAHGFGHRPRRPV